MGMIPAMPVRASSFGLADLYPEAKGPLPSTSQLANPHEVAAARSVSASVLTGPPSLRPGALLEHRVTWVLLVAAALLIYGASR